MTLGRVRSALSAILDDRVRFDHPMSKQTSLRVGGPADALASPATREELAAILALGLEHGLRVRVIGSGFNTLVLDEGMDGIVLHLKAFRALGHDAEHVHVEAGVSHSRLTNYCVEHALSGLEAGCGIPGTLGGWVTMNAGIGVWEVKDVLSHAEILVPGEDRTRTLDHTELRFVYRHAAGLPVGAVVVGCALRVTPGEKSAIQAEVKRLLGKRSGTQPIDRPSCGSVFKNPEGDHAGRLIESVGLKGKTVGGAQISTLHANFIVNTGGATAADVLALIETAREQVAQETGVTLEPEVHIVGRGR